jgi:hypothetical protein
MKTITNIVYNFVRNQLAKSNMGQGKGITSLPNAADIEIGMTEIYNLLRKGGFDAVSAGKAIKNKDDLARTISEIKQKEISDQQFFNQDPNRLDIIIDKMNKGIPLNKGDQFALEGSGFETQLDAFRGFEPKVIQGGKSEKELLEKMNKQNKEAVERIKKRKDTDPDKKAEGGRASYFKGGITSLYKGIKGLQQGRIQKELINKYKSQGMNLIEALNKATLEATQIVKNRKLKIIQDKLNETSVLTDDYVTLIDEEIKLNDPELFEDIIKFEKNNRPDLADKMRALRHPDWAEANFGKNYEDVLQDRQNKAIKQMMDDIPNVKERTVVDDIDDMNQANIDEFLGRKKNAEGGRIGYFKGGVATLLEFLQSKLGKKAITTADKIDRPESALNREMFGAFEDRMNRKILDVPPMPSGFKLSKEKLLKNFPELDESYADEIMAMDKELQGRVLTMLKDRRKNPEAYDKLLMEKGDTLDFQGEFDRSVQRSKNAEGGLMRLGFEKGSPPSKGRRNFLKLMGGLAALPVVGKFFKFAEPASKAVEAAKKATDVPPYFIKLVEKIKLLGDDVTSTRATGERQAVKEYKGYELTESLTIKRDGYTSEEYLEYIPGGQYYDETRKKVIKYPDSYEEVTVKPDAEGKMKDVDFGLDSYDEILEEVGEAKIKKAGGGLAYMLGM